MNIRNFDLNLLIIFRDLFATLSVSQTAINLGLSQPAVSHALNRLREGLDDELFIRSGRSFTPTDRAIKLGGFLQVYLNDLEKNLFDQSKWEAIKSDKQFKISGTAFDSFIWFPKFMSTLEKNAPNIKMTMKGIVLEEFLDRMIRGDIDLSFAGDLDEIKNFSIRTLGEHRFCILANKSSRHFKKKVTLTDYLEAKHILYTPTEKPGSSVDDIFKANGKKRNISIRTSYLNSIPMLIEKRDFLSIVPESYGRHVTKYFNVKLLDLPFEMSPFRHQIVWHKSRDKSEPHKWLRNYIIENYHSFF